MFITRKTFLRKPNLMDNPFLYFRKEWSDNVLSLWSFSWKLENVWFSLAGACKI